MPARCVLVHECEPKTDDGKKFSCSCMRLVASRDAHDLVAGGRARWKQQLMAGGGLVPVHYEVILIERRHALHARTIGDSDIARAYVDDEKYARERIECFDPRRE